MRLIPSSEYLDVPSHAEHKVAELLTAIHSDDGVAYHSVRLPRHRKKVLGEVDFVVLWKGTILVLEVKGGRIGRTKKGLWYSMDRQGNQHRLRRSPWVQARDTTYALLNLLTHRPDEGQWPFAYAVVTPDQDLAADTAWDPHQHIGSDRMTPTGMERSLDALARRAHTPPGDPVPPRRQALHSSEDFPAVLTHLRREVDAMLALPGMRTSIDQNTMTVTDQQADE